MKRAMQELLDEDQMNGRMMTCAQSGATYTEATAFYKKAFGIDNPKILSSRNIEIRAGTVLTDQLYFCQDASEGPSSCTYFKPHKLVCPDEHLLMGNFTLVTRNAEEFCLSENLEKIIAEYGCYYYEALILGSSDNEGGIGLATGRGAKRQLQGVDDGMGGRDEAADPPSAEENAARRRKSSIGIDGHLRIGWCTRLADLCGKADEYIYRHHS